MASGLLGCVAYGSHTVTVFPEETGPEGRGRTPQTIPPFQALGLLTAAASLLPQLPITLSSNEAPGGTTEVCGACAYMLHMEVWRSQGHKATCTLPPRPFSPCGLEQSQAAATPQSQGSGQQPMVWPLTTGTGILLPRSPPSAQGPGLVS